MVSIYDYVGALSRGPFLLLSTGDGIGVQQQPQVVVVCFLKLDIIGYQLSKYFWDQRW